MKRYKMTLTALTPIHIGTGQEVTPFDYVIIYDKRTEYSFFIRIDLPRFLAELTDDMRRKFDYAVNQSNTRYIRKFIRDQIDPLRYRLYDAPVSSDLAKLYNQKLDSPDNQLIINPCMRLPGTWQPYIPGSSIKGAIRTAVVSAVANKKLPDSRQARIEPRYFESDALGYGKNIRCDPFRTLLLEDITLPADSVSIDRAIIFKLKKDNAPDPGGIQQFYERTFSFLDGEDISGCGVLTIHDELAGKTTYDRTEHTTTKAITMPLTAELLAQACREFYLPKMKAEHKKFYETSDDLKNSNSPLMNNFGEESHYGPLEFPLRLGHFSHCECVTVDKFRKPKTRMKNGRPFPSGTTRTLVAGELPFGWAKIALTPLD